MVGSGADEVVGAGGGEGDGGGAVAVGADGVGAAAGGVVARRHFVDGVAGIVVEY